MTEPLQDLQKAVCSYKSHIQQISELRKETVACLDEIQSIIKLNRKKELAELKALQLPESELNNRPCILFIGSQNCGKSTLLNVFLKKSSLLPTDETPCTSRIVRIVYSSKNQTKFEDPKTNLERIKSFKNKVPQGLVVLQGEARNDSSQLQVIVEVGLNHPLLECGIELIDSPGRNENEALDRVVEEFVEKGIVPLIVYVVDGNYHLRDKDRTTIRELQDKFPNVSLMFVCSKVDVDKNAKRYDHDDDDDEDCKDGLAEPQEMFDRARQKKIAVFNQLKSLEFLPQEDQMHSSELFHGFSAKLVKKARKKKQKNEATMSFERFELCILEKLESSLRKKSKRELAALLTAQEMFLASVIGTQRSLLFVTREMEHDYKRAKEAEETIFTMIGHLIDKGDSVINTIGHDLQKLSEIFLQEAEDYQYTTKGKGANKATLVEEFSRNTKGSILDRTFNVLRRSFQRIFKKGLLNSVILNELNKSFNPLIRRMLQRALGNERQMHLEDDKESGIAVYVVLERVIDSVKDDVDIFLRNEIKSQLEKVDISQVVTAPKPPDPLWRRKVVQTLLTKIDIKYLADEVIRICERALWRKRQQFKANIDAMTFFNNVFSEDLGPKLDDMRTKYVPLVAHLAVRGHSLRYVIKIGPLKLGPQIKATAHGQLFCCASPLWGDIKDTVVKRVKRDDVGQEVWSQTMRDCMHLKDMNDKLCVQHPNLLELRGWYFPEPDQLYIVMEKAECDLLTALKGGLSWERRKDVAVDVARGLEAMHNVHYVYQDLKPQNVMLTADGTAKINFCKPEKPFETTELGLPFHISPKMFMNYKTEDFSSTAYDIYAFGSLLWVLCEGSGSNRPQGYSHCKDIEAIKFAVCESGIKPERPFETPEAWWELLSLCWTGGEADIKVVLEGLLKIDTPNVS